MGDAVEDYRSASARGDIEAVAGLLSADAELVSPISARAVFRGHEDVAFVLGNVYAILRDIRWTRRVGDGPHSVLLGEARIAGLRMTDALAFELAEDGRIRRIAPHLRPWLALTVFAALLGPRVARRPGALRRAFAG